MSETAPLISDLALILVIAGIVTLIFKKLNQPIILGYILSGFLTSPYFPLTPNVSDPANIETWAEIGIIFLLFAMGLDFSFKKLMRVGGTAVISAIIIVAGMMLVGYTAGNAMGFSHISSLFLGGMLSMSSTAIVFKAFDEMGLRDQKFAGVVIGILVVEDLVGVVLMVLLSTLAVSKQVEGMEMLNSILKLASFLIFWSILGIYLIPTFLKKAKQLLNDETLLIISLGLCLAMVMIAVKAGFSAALGAFVMGSLLAETVQASKIERLVKPVKDLFGAIFFVSVGMMIDPSLLTAYFVPILVLTLLVLVGQSFFGSVGVLVAGQPLKIAVQSGFSLTQVGEFAFIIATLGTSLGVTESFLYPVIVAVSVITTFLTPYMMRLAEPTYNFLDKRLPTSTKILLARYTSGSNTVRHKNAWHSLIRSMMIPVALYATFCVFSIVIFFTYISPIIMDHLPDWRGKTLSLLVILTILLPSFWAIVMKKNHSPEFKKLWNDNKYNRGPLVSLILIKVIICVSILMPVISHIFNVATGIGLVISIAIIVAAVFSKGLRKRSLSIERRFLENFSGSDTRLSTLSEKEIAGRLPFDELHLVEQELPPYLSCLGKTLKEVNFRQRYGLNIVAIIRGDMRLNIPNGNERLFPYDKIVIVGTDEELERARASYRSEKQEHQAKTENTSSDFLSIEQYAIEPASPWDGQTISQSRIKEMGNCLIIGIERNGQAIMNPPANTRLQANDILWLAGERKQILALFGEKKKVN